MRVCRATHQVRVSLYLPATGLMRDSRLPPRAVLGPSFQHCLFPHKSCCVFSVQVHSVPCLSPTQTSPVPSASPCNVRTAPEILPLFLPLLAPSGTHLGLPSLSSWSPSFPKALCHILPLCSSLPRVPLLWAPSASIPCCPPFSLQVHGLDQLCLAGTGTPVPRTETVERGWVPGELERAQDSGCPLGQKTGERETADRLDRELCKEMLEFLLSQANIPAPLLRPPPA